jgi:hypothetical protein
MNEYINIKFWSFKLNDKHQYDKNEKWKNKNIFWWKNLSWILITLFNIVFDKRV